MPAIYLQFLLIETGKPIIRLMKQLEDDSICQALLEFISVESPQPETLKTLISDLKVKGNMGNAQA